MIYISKKFKQKLISYSFEGLPNEVCGILAGNFFSEGNLKDRNKKRKVEKIYFMQNKNNSSESYLMKPKKQLKVIKDIRKSNLEMVGIFHSHPETKARPSENDIEMAFYSEVSYVIVSLKNRERTKIKSFRIIDKEVTEENIKIEK